MEIKDEKLKLVKSILNQFEAQSQGLGNHLKSLHLEKNRDINNEVTMQHIWDAHQDARLLRDLIVVLFDLEEIDPKEENYLDEWFKPDLKERKKQI